MTTTEYSVLDDVLMGGYVWIWEAPDGAAVMGTAATEDQARADAERQIAAWKCEDDA